MITTSTNHVMVLRGHTSMATAHLVDHDPTLFTTGASVRYWIDTVTSGPQRGKQRFVSQFSNPNRQGDPWNQPKRGSYQLMAWMFLDANDRIGHLGIGTNGLTPCLHTAIGLLGISDQMTTGERVGYDLIFQASQRDPRPWLDWDREVDMIADHLLLTDDRPPVLHDRATKLITGQALTVSATGLAIRVAAARALRAGRPAVSI
jgi:hypothetical protein